MVLVFWGMVSSAQTIPVHLIEKTPLKTERFIGIDKFDNQYTITAQTLSKTTGQKTYQYSDLQLGNISNVSLLNPLKLTVFYKAMNTVVLLDDQLSLIQKIQFNQLPSFKTVNFATTAADHQLWLINATTSQLELYNYQNNTTVAQSAPIAGEIIAISGNFNFCWVLTDSHLNLYNTYGNLLIQQPFKGGENIHSNQNSALIQTDKGLVLFNSKTQKRHRLELLKIDFKTFYLNGKNLYLYDGQYSYHYSFNLSK